MSAVLPPELSPRSTSPAAKSPSSRRWVTWLTTALAAVVLVTSTGGWVMATYYDAKISRMFGLSGLLSGDSSGPLTILIVGSDSREGLTKAEARELSTGHRCEHRIRPALGHDDAAAHRRRPEERHGRQSASRLLRHDPGLHR